MTNQEVIFLNTCRSTKIWCWMNVYQDTQRTEKLSMKYKIINNGISTNNQSAVNWGMLKIQKQTRCIMYQLDHPSLHWEAEEVHKQSQHWKKKGTNTSKKNETKKTSSTTKNTTAKRRRIPVGIHVAAVALDATDIQDNLCRPKLKHRCSAQSESSARAGTKWNRTKNPAISLQL